MLIDRKRNHIKERRDRQEQRLRMEQMAAKMSAKKLQRLQKVCLDVELEHVYKLTINSDRDDQRIGMLIILLYYLSLLCTSHVSPFCDRESQVAYHTCTLTDAL
jgi:hypothetical protein